MENELTLYLCNGKRCAKCSKECRLTTEKQFAVCINGNPIKVRAKSNLEKEVKL